MLAACGDDDGSPRPTPTASATKTSAPTGTATAIPTATEPPPPTPTATVPATTTATVTQTPTLSVVDELQASGIGRYLGAATPGRSEIKGEWTEYFFAADPAGPICLRGGAYQVNVRRGTSDNVLLFLQGGGACWNTQTCWTAPLATLEAGSAGGGGILDASNPANPFRDWTVVYAPYCDGSVFSGDNVVDYDGHTTYHHGLHNLSATVDVMRAQVPAPGRIVVAGVSAGGYGTLSGYGVTRIAFPDTPLVVFNDSGPGLQNPDAPEAIAERETNWNFRQFVPETCTDCETQLTFLIDWALARDPELRVSLFNYLQDLVLRFFLAVTPDALEEILRAVTDEVSLRHPDRFKRYFKQGASHTVLTSPEFYTLSVRETSVLDWTTAFLAGDAAWQDVIEGVNPYAGYRSERYASDDLWLCKAGKADDQCSGHSLDATAVLPDLSLAVQPHLPAAAEPGFDCFYVYPTVDLTGPVGNHTDFSDISLELDPLLSQAARFNGVCRIFAPLYRQITLASFGAPNAAELLAFAYADVEDAFRHYMGQYNNGRDVVIMGHSQGTRMTTELLQKEFDDVPGLRERLITALLIGGGVTVPDGQTVGGSFQNLPLCTADEQTGCIVAYRSYADGFAPTGGSNDPGGEGLDMACTNPAALGGGKALFSGTYLPLSANQPLFRIGMDLGLPIETPFALFEDFYAGECVRDAEGHSYLRISVEPGSGDLRTNPIPFNHGVLAPGFLGTHILDYNFPLGDMIELVRIKAEATGN
ncbi:MAG: pectin acetylesterase-family hydrolase [Candidatus Binatia bacterium]